MTLLLDARTIQRSLTKWGLYRGEIDGKFGPQSKNAVDLAFGEPWSYERKLVAVQQRILVEASIDTGDIDGFVGPATLHAVELWQNQLRDVVSTEDEVVHQPTVWPRQSGVSAFYGKVGTRQKMLELPFPMRIAWNPSQMIRRFSVHERVHDSATRVFDAILAHYGLEEIQRLRLDFFGGCLNVRKMRGGSAYSMHSWGIAIDFDPERNQLRWGRDRASLAGPDYEKFWNLWEAEGWISLGRERNFDWMHVQAARL